jgi:hypothetical protein
MKEKLYGIEIETSLDFCEPDEDYDDEEEINEDYYAPITEETGWVAHFDCSIPAIRNNLKVEFSSEKMSRETAYQHISRVCAYIEKNKSTESWWKYSVENNTCKSAGIHIHSNMLSEFYNETADFVDANVRFFKRLAMKPPKAVNHWSPYKENRTIRYYSGSEGYKKYLAIAYREHHDTTEFRLFTTPYENIESYVRMAVQTVWVIEDIVETYTPLNMEKFLEQAKQYPELMAQIRRTNPKHFKRMLEVA